MIGFGSRRRPRDTVKSTAGGEAEEAESGIAKRENWDAGTAERECTAGRGLHSQAAGETETCRIGEM